MNGKEKGEIYWGRERVKGRKREKLKVHAGI